MVVLGQSHEIELRVLGITRVFIRLIGGSGTVTVRSVAMQVSKEYLITLEGNVRDTEICEGECARANHDRGYRAQAEEVSFEREGFHVRAPFMWE